MGCGGFTCSKNALAALNVLYILVAFILIGVAAYGKAVAIITSISIMSGIIACGMILFLVAIIGLVGAIKHHQVLLFFYMVILFLLFLVQFAVACALLAVNDSQQDSLAEGGWRKSGDGLKSKVQHFFDCCGFDETSQFNASSKYELGHPACFEKNKHNKLIYEVTCCVADKAGKRPACCDPEVSPNKTGNGTSNNEDSAEQDCNCPTCLSKIHDHMNQALKIAGGIGLFFSFTEILGVWLTVRYRNLKDPRANPSAFL